MSGTAMHVNSGDLRAVVKRIQALGAVLFVTVWWAGVVADLSALLQAIISLVTMLALAVVKAI